MPKPEGVLVRPGFHRSTVIFSLAVFAVAIASVVLANSDVIPVYRTARAQTHRVSVLASASPLIDDAVSSPPAVSASGSAGSKLVVPILMYHYIRINPVATDKIGFGLSVTPDDFAAQMTYLHDTGAHTVTLAQVMSALNGGLSLPPHPVVLTFDDGHDDFATEAAPMMKRYGFVGTDYVVPGFLGHTTYMTAEQVIQVDSLGMVIGAHTVHHVALADVSPAVAQAEIVGSKQLLQQLLGHPIFDFAYPYGSYNPAVGQLVQAAGFRDAVTTYNGDVQYSTLPFVLDRFRVGGGESLAAFANQALLPPPPPGWTAPTAAELLASSTAAAPKSPSETTLPPAVSLIIRGVAGNL